LPAAETAARSGYTPASLASAVRDFRVGAREFFFTGRPGPRTAPAKDAAHPRIIELRAAGHSIDEIADAGRGHPLNRTGIAEVIAAEGLPRMWRRPDADRGREGPGHLGPRRSSGLRRGGSRAETRLTGLFLARRPRRDLSACPRPIRQLAVTGLGHDQPTLLITNWPQLLARHVIRSYACPGGVSPHGEDSGAIAVQIVCSSRRCLRNIEQLRSAHDELEPEALKAAARQQFAAGQGELDRGLAAGALLRRAAGDHIDADGAPVGGAVPYLSHTRLRPGHRGDEFFRQRVPPEITEPASKQDSLRMLGNGRR
jgi:hypothetical protein